MRKLAKPFLLACLCAPALALGGCEQPPAVNPDEATAQTSPEATPEAPAGEGQADAPGDAASGDAALGGDADQTDLPAAAEVMAKNVDAMGGKAKIDSIKSYYSETKLEIPAQNMNAVTKLWWQDGNLYAETEMTGVGVTKMWRKDGALWSKDPVNGLREVKGKEASQAAWSNALVLSAEWNKYFATATTTGRRKSGDKTLLDVTLKSADGEEVIMSFDESTWLVAEQSFKQESPMGQMPITLIVNSYDDYDGFKSVSSSVMDMSVLKANNTVVKFEPNAKVDAKLFTPPKS